MNVEEMGFKDNEYSWFEERADFLIRFAGSRLLRIFMESVNQNKRAT